MGQDKERKITYSYCHWQNSLDLGQFMCFPRGATTFAEELKKKRQEVPQHNWKQSFAARICSSLQKTFSLLTEGRPSPRNLSFCHPSQHENLNPRRKTNIYVFCVIRRKLVLIVSFYICIQLPKGTFATGHSHVSVWRVVFASAWNKLRAFILRDWCLGADFLLLLGVHGGASSTGLQEWRYLNCKINVHQRNSAEPSERLEGIAKTRADEGALQWKELFCAQWVSDPDPVSTYNQMARLIFNFLMFQH